MRVMTESGSQLPIFLFVNKCERLTNVKRILIIVYVVQIKRIAVYKVKNTILQLLNIKKI